MTPQEHADHICEVLGLDRDTALLSGLATYLAVYVAADARNNWTPVEETDR